MKTHSTAVWHGGSADGKGTVSSKSEALPGVAFGSPVPHKFEKMGETNPEELIAAAHATCYTLTLAHILHKAGVTPESLETSAEVSLEKGSQGLAMTTSHLTVRARIPGVDPDRFREMAAKAEAACLVGKHLKLDITMDAALEG
jgi:osmotically inducible protein OsmC